MSSYIASHRHKKILDEINWNEVDLDTRIIKPTLNQKLWDEDKLREDVRKAAVAIAKEYYEYLKISPVKLKDVRLTGSMANYNWTDNSDLDIHLVLDSTEVDENLDLVSEFFATKKSLWEIKHDINIKGVPVELYAQDVSEPHRASGVYSLVQNKWLAVPEKHKSISVDVVDIKRKAAGVMNIIDDLSDIKSEERRYQLVDKVKDRIKAMRQAGLDSKESEYSIGNMAFKVLRNTGYLEKLSNMKTQAFDKMLSLNEGIMTRGDIKRISDEKKKEQSQYNTLLVQEGIDGMTDEKIEIIKDFICFVRQKLEIEKPVKIALRRGRDEYIQTTASYMPSEDINFIRCGGRALVDICRSISHEMAHQKQASIGMFGKDEQVQNIGGFIEDQANAIAGIFIKDFTSNYGYERIFDLM